MYPIETRRRALAMRRAGFGWSEISRRVGVRRSALRAWQGQPGPATRSSCPCCEAVPLDHPAYAALLGYYLGDGCISNYGRSTVLRVTCDAAYPRIICDLRNLMERVHPERPIVLEDWQRAIVEVHPGAFLRGLFHSDGSRVRNWARRPVAGVVKRYEYPQWQFVNASSDIRELCCWALDLADIPWRQSNTRCISVSRREAVARLDALIGLKQ